MWKPMARVLVVDDDPDLREMIRLTLEANGYCVSEAENGRDGLDMLDGVHADLVLLDLWMPVMSGSAFVEELHNRGEARCPGVIAMSGHCDARSSPAKWFLSKPIDVTLLLAVVSDFCGRGATSPHSAEQRRGGLTAAREELRRLASGVPALRIPRT
jgi:DNA-binding response OmpR family regulator